tara:strand:+ start:12 stop:1061 length:1050 start_codon:yes stop_codon:yes gene_type:complete
MYLVCFGTRPELIKQIPIIQKFKEKKVPFKTLFSGQHLNLIKQFLTYIEEPDYVLTNVMKKGQSLNELVGKMLQKSQKVLNENDFKIIVQGDSSTSFAMALSGFQNKNKIIHVEAGLRTYDKNSPFPEEINRVSISNIADVHLCPTEQSVINLNKEGIRNNVYLTGNTIVDSYKFFSKQTLPSSKIGKFISDNKKFVICTLHRRENREKFTYFWKQLNEITEQFPKYKILYLKHPSVDNSEENLNKQITIMNPVSYIDMVHLIDSSSGIISDSGGIQEEVVSAKKKILICRNTTERPETIKSGYGKLVNDEITSNFNFLNKNVKPISKNPFGSDVSEKIFKILNSEFQI